MVLASKTTTSTGFDRVFQRERDVVQVVGDDGEKTPTPTVDSFYLQDIPHTHAIGDERSDDMPECFWPARSV